MTRPRKRSTCTSTSAASSQGGSKPVFRCRPPVLLLAATAAWALSAVLPGTTDGQPKVSFLTGASSSLHQSQPRSAVAQRGLPQPTPVSPLPKQRRGARPLPRVPHPGRKKFEGLSKRRYLERLRHRRWAAQSKFPRIFGYVEKWSDEKGEGLIMDQEKKQMYFVIRDEIGRCYHNFKTLQRAEMVEFFASDEIDDEVNLPLAKNVSGPYGRYVKGSEEYRNRMLAYGTFPKRWQDTPEEYPDKGGEYWLRGKWRRQ